MKSEPKKEKKKKKRLWIKILLFILAILIIIAGIVTYKTIKNGGGVQGFLATMVGHNEQTLKDLSEIQFLLVGESGNMTDTIMACSYNPTTQRASLLSIPRDTFIGDNESKATSSDKINSIYNRYKKPEKLVEEVNKITGLNLKYYIFVDTKALKELVNAIGGVEFYVPIDMDYDDTTEQNYLRIHLKKGQQKLNGDQAEQLVRFRHNNDGSTYPSEYGEQDIGRMRTQREFITAVLKQTLKPGNIIKLGEFLEIANKNVQTNLPISIAKDYIPYAVNFNTENLETGTLPGTPEKLNGVWVYLKNNSESQILINNMFFGGSKEQGQHTEETDSSAITLQVVNGSSKAENLYEVVEKLKSKGYIIVKVGNTTAKAKTTIINRTKQSNKEEKLLKEAITYGTITSGKNTEKVDFTVIIGKDYK